MLRERMVGLLDEVQVETVQSESGAHVGELRSFDDAVVRSAEKSVQGEILEGSAVGCERRRGAAGMCALLRIAAVAVVGYH